MGGGRKPRHRRRRRRGRRLDLPPVNPEHSRWLAESAADAGKTDYEFRRAKNTESDGARRMRKAAEDSVEMYVGNLPHGTKGRDLAQFLQQSLSSSSSPFAARGGGGAGAQAEPPVLGCKVKKKGATFAFATVRSETEAKKLEGQELYLGGRRLRVSRARGSVKKPMSTTPGFVCDSVQLCAESPPGEKMTVVWEVNSGRVEFQVSRTTSLARLRFELSGGGVGQAEFKRRHVDGPVQLMEEAGQMWLVFTLLRPPFLSAAGMSLQTSAPLSLIDELFNDVDLTALLGGSSDWEVTDDHDWGCDKDMERTGDLAQNGAFGSCLTYRIGVSSLPQRERSRLFGELHAFRLCHSPGRPRSCPIGVVIGHDPERPRQGWQVTAKGRMLYSRLPYNVVYLLECLTTNFKLDPLSVDEDMLSLLHDTHERHACKALESMFGTDPRRRLQKPAVFELRRWLEFHGGVFLPRDPDSSVGSGGGGDTRIVMIRRAIVTPTRVVCLPLEEEQSNGVTRHYARHSERFVRVTLGDENLGRLPAPLSKYLKKRLEEVMDNGILLAGRRYMFLAYSSSQLRTHSCWFYAEPGADEGLRRRGTTGVDRGVARAADIRAWVGDLKSITVVGKHGARLGQSLSTTTSTVKVPPHRLGRVEDKDCGPYQFTDGVGIMSRDLSRTVAARLDLPQHQAPSAYQVRIGGCKGMLAVWPDDVLESVAGSPGLLMAVRPSMKKFESGRNDLDVIQYARRLPFYLNRQLITLLTTLGVPDKRIEVLYTEMVDGLNEMVRDQRAAEEALVRYYNSASARSKGKKQYGPLWEALAMVKAGFDVTTTPYLQNVLRASRGKAMVDLRNKTRIFVPDAVCLIGVVDETGLLQPGEVFFSVAPNPGRPHAQECTVLPPGTEVLVCRNPSLHPGDLRVLRTADIPELHHLRNVIVFSSLGDRPEPSKMSGGDLDGDLYAIIMDPDLLPPPTSAGGYRNSEPMGYEAPVGVPVKASGSHVTVKEITQFVINYIVNDNLGMICNSHLAWADSLPEGARCPQCLQLAALASTAVDFCKTGVPATFPKDLRVQKYPDFMGKKNPDKMYRSEKLIGRLFRKTPELGEGGFETRSAGSGGEHWNARYLETFEIDHDLLVPGWEEFIEEAEAEFARYSEQLLRLANKYGVFDEGQLVSGQVVRFRAKSLRKAKLEDVQGRLNLDIAQLKATLRRIFHSTWEQEEGEDDDDDDGPADDDDDDDPESPVAVKEVELEDRQRDAAADQSNKQPFEDGDQTDPEDNDEGDDTDGRPIPGVERLQKASAWYFVSHSPETNVYVHRVRVEAKRRNTIGGSWGTRQDGVNDMWPTTMMSLSFPWVAAHEYLCETKRVSLARRGAMVTVDDQVANR